MPTYPFLSDEWIEAARAIREEYRGKAAPLPFQVKINQIITDVPFGEGTIEAHIDSSSGELELDLGTLSDPDVTVSLDYATARSVFLNPASGMQAFMEGKIKATGDITRLMVMAQAPPDPVAVEVQQQLVAITE